LKGEIKEKLRKLWTSAQCPMLDRCHNATGIDCKDRNFRECDLFMRLLGDKFGSGVPEVVKNFGV